MELMRKKTGITVAAFPAILFLMIVFAGGSQAENREDRHPEKTPLMNRIDFGNSYIMGQSIKSGAVYLLQRKKSEISSMLKCRTDYRSEILEDFPVKESENERKAETGKP
ncbi:MAG: hypothetical protein C4522_02355 [Desulfobacteraceae bacterium]|nr:MAG: hypothetical protein C4522_02355 [Desulfobacteraceae bacterium]